jgi:hypothetical protein
MYLTYGASSQGLFLYASDQDRYRRMVKAEINKLSRRDLIRLLQSADYVNDSSDLLVSTGPSPTDRSVPERKIASPYVFEECRKRALSDLDGELRWFRLALDSDPAMSTAHGAELEHRVLSQFLLGRWL